MWRQGGSEACRQRRGGREVARHVGRGVEAGGSEAKKRRGKEAGVGGGSEVGRLGEG